MYCLNYLVRSNSRKGSNPRKSNKTQPKAKTVYDPRQREKYSKKKSTPTNSRPSSKNSKEIHKKMNLMMSATHKRNSSALSKELNSRPLSPGPGHLAADIARFHKLSQKLKATKGHSALGFTSNENIFSQLGGSKFS